MYAILVYSLNGNMDILGMHIYKQTSTDVIPTNTHASHQQHTWLPIHGTHFKSAGLQTATTRAHSEPSRARSSRAATQQIHSRPTASHELGKHAAINQY